MINEYKIHAHKANEARRAQILAFEDEQQWADRTYPNPRAYKKEPLTFSQVIEIIINVLNPKKFLP